MCYIYFKYILYIFIIYIFLLVLRAEIEKLRSQTLGGEGVIDGAAQAGMEEIVSLKEQLAMKEKEMELMTR